MSQHEQDTIVAVSTPPGQGGIGIIRLSGSRSFELVRRIFVRGGKKAKPPRGLQEAGALQPRRLYYGYIVDTEGRELDEVLVSFMPAPHTYTREDVVEINAHGGPVPLAKILKLLLTLGARLAEAGEFTKRAFLNGRIDLVQAESVLSLVNARSEKGLYASIQGLKGFLSRELEKMARDLFRLRALIEAEADFPLEDVEGEDYREISQRVEKIKEQAVLLQRRSAQGRILQEGLKTVIAGKPNVGKSSLYNYLLKEDRAIVTPVPGTTRDLLTDYVNLKGIPLYLIDTAGLRPAADTVEKIGIDYARRAIAGADLVLFMLDLSGGIDREDLWVYASLPDVARQKVIILGNKLDLGDRVSPGEIEKLFPGNKFIKMSVATGEGLEALEEEIIKIVNAGEVGGGESALVLSARQAGLLEEMASSLEDAAKALAAGLPLDLVAVDLENAYSKLQNLLGKEIPADLLGEIFSNFCIGK